MCDYNLPSAHLKRSLGDSLWTSAIYLESYMGLKRGSGAIPLANRHLSRKWRKQCQQLVDISAIPTDLIPPDYMPSTSEEGVLPETIVKAMFNPLVSPLLNPDLKGLPTALIYSCNFDRLRDEGIIYAKRLETAGVKTKFVLCKQCFHGSLNMFDKGTFRSAERMFSIIVQYIKENL